MNYPEVNFRAIRLGDANEIAQIVSGADYVQSTRRMPFEAQEVWRRKILAQDAASTWIVIEVSGALAGHGLLRRQTEPAFTHVGVLSLGLGEAFTGRGLGKLLLAKLLDVADNWYGLKRVELSVMSRNMRAIALYRHFEFVEEGINVGKYYRNGEYVNGIAMARTRF